MGTQLVIGTIKPLQSGTRLRKSINTKGEVVKSYGPGDKIEVDQIITHDITNADLSITAGDKWARVTKINGNPPTDTLGKIVTVPVYMAIFYQKGNPPVICSEHYIPVTDPETPPTSEKPKPLSAVMTVKWDDGTESTHNLDVVQG